MLLKCGSWGETLVAEFRCSVQNMIGIHVEKQDTLLTVTKTFCIVVEKVKYMPKDLTDQGRIVGAFLRGTERFFKCIALN